MYSVQLYSCIQVLTAVQLYGRTAGSEPLAIRECPDEP
eukprot:SAG22_NODE_9931_length_563_cov_0.605603_1_plen_37_part_10